MHKKCDDLNTERKFKISEKIYYKKENIHTYMK